MRNKLGFTFILLCLAAAAFGQNRVMDIGPEIQIYPTGIIPGVRFEHSINERWLATARLGYQFIDHRDLGKHDDEMGSGFGGTLGLKRYFSSQFQGLSLGVRTDLWANRIDWTTNTDTGTIKGKSDIIVVQPTAELGWAFKVGEKLVLTPALAFGFEVNIKTKGEATGEGAILLAGITAAYRIPY